MRPLATALDTVGWFARSVEDLTLLRAVLSPVQSYPLERLAQAPRIGIVRTADWGTLRRRRARSGGCGRGAARGWMQRSGGRVA